MQKYTNNAQDNNGNAQSGDQILVTNAATGNAAVIYSDNGITTTGNPLTADVNGMFSFYAPNGRYTVTASNSSGGSRTISDIVLFDPADSGSAAIIGATDGSAGSLWTTVQGFINKMVSQLAGITAALNIPSLPTASSPANDADLMLISQGTVNNKITVGTVRTEFATGAVAAQVAAVAAQVAAESARDAALHARGIFATTAKALSSGVANTTGLVGGSGGTNGTFALAFSGGGGSGAAGVFTVAGGAVTSVTITATGDSYTSAPTISFAASTGLTGASATAVIAPNADVGEYFSVPAATAGYFDLYQVTAGPAATLIKSGSTILASVAYAPKSAAVNGALPAGVSSPNSFTTGSATISPLVHTYLNSIGCSYAYTLSILGSLQETYYRVDTAPKTLKQGAWVAVSYFVYATDWTWLSTGRVRVQAIPVSGTSQVIDIRSSYVQIDANTYRFNTVFQLNSNFASSPLSFLYLECTAPAGRTATVQATGYTATFSEQQLGSVDWSDFDPYSTTSQNSQLSSMSTRLNSVDGANLSSPDILVPSSFHVLQGRPLELYRNAMMTARESAGYDIAASCLDGNQPAIEYASPVLALDGNRFSGAGAIRAKHRYADDTQVWNKSVTFYSSPATKVGSPKILVIGDSLSWKGSISLMDGKLAAAGVTASYIGTRKETGGLWTEARSSWDTRNFTYSRYGVNADNTGPIYPILTGAGSGATFTATVSGGAVTGITASGGSGYDNAPAVPLVISGGGGALAWATVAISGGVPGVVTMISGGSGYTSAPTVTLPLNLAGYNALDSSINELGTRWSYNPFIRQSTVGDPAGNIKNGYVFDVAFYLSRFLFANPDIVILALGANDTLHNSGNPSVALASATESFPILYTQIRAALPNAHVAIVMNGFATANAWASAVGIFKMLYQNYNAREAEKIWMLPVYAAIDPKLAYTLNVSATDSQTGMQTATIADSTHPATIGFSQHGEMLFQFVMNRL